MTFSGGVLTVEGANKRFDAMLVRADELPFAKQPVIERPTGTIVGYAGVDRFLFEGQQWLEFGWRLVPGARGHGYATEAVTALLDLADQFFEGELLAMIDPRNTPSRNVAEKVGFVFWKEALVDGYLDNLYRLQIPRTRHR